MRKSSKRSLQFVHKNLLWILICPLHASCYASLSCDSNISWSANVMNFLLWDFLSHFVTSSRSSPAFSLSTFVSVTTSLFTFTGLELSFHICSKEKIQFYSERLNAAKSPLVKVSWSEDFYALLTEYSYVLFHTTTAIIPHTTMNMRFILCMHFLIHISCTHWSTWVMI